MSQNILEAGILLLFCLTFVASAHFDISKESISDVDDGWQTAFQEILTIVGVFITFIKVFRIIYTVYGKSLTQHHLYQVQYQVPSQPK